MGEQMKTKVAGLAWLNDTTFSKKVFRIPSTIDAGDSEAVAKAPVMKLETQATTHASDSARTLSRLADSNERRPQSRI